MTRREVYSLLFLPATIACAIALLLNDLSLAVLAWGAMCWSWGCSAGA